MQRVIGLALLLAMSTSALLNVQELGTVKAKCQTLIDESGNNLVAGLVRLIFHDCVGGCNGCVQLNLVDAANGDEPNAGLNRYIPQLETGYDEISNTVNISRADFWAACSVVALDEGRGAPLNIDMKYGRLDCPGGAVSSNVPRDPASTAQFPNPRSGLTDTLAWCSATFGLSPRECVALLGAHTLGRARTPNSGYNGPWVRNQIRLDNAYYRDMRNRAWTQRNNGPGPSVTDARWQFETVIAGRNRPRTLMMLNADICFLKDIQPTSAGEVTQPLSSVSDSTTKQFVDEFANNDATWITAFKEAFKKMVETPATGQPALQSVV